MSKFAVSFSRWVPLVLVVALFTISMSLQISAQDDGFYQRPISLMDNEDEDDEFNPDLSHSSSTLQDVEAGDAELAGEEEGSEKFRFPDLKRKDINQKLIDLMNRLKKLKQEQAISRGFRMPEYPTRGYKNVGKSNTAHILDEDAAVENNDDVTFEDDFDTSTAYDGDDTEVEGRGLGEKRPQEELVRYRPWMKKKGNEMRKGGRIPIKVDGRKLIDSDVDDYLVDEDAEKFRFRMGGAGKKVVGGLVIGAGQAAIAEAGRKIAEKPVLTKREKAFLCACCGAALEPACCSRCVRKTAP